MNKGIKKILLVILMLFMAVNSVLVTAENISETDITDINEISESFTFEEIPQEEPIEQVEEIIQEQEVLEEKQEEVKLELNENIEVLENIDFNSKRLIVASENANIFSDNDPIISEYNGLYLLQYESEELAKQAYLRFLDVAEFVEPDVEVKAADEEEMPEIDSSKEAELTEKDNAFVELEQELNKEEIFEEIKDNKVTVIALLDSGTRQDSHVIGRVSMLGDHVDDDNGHGNRMLDYMIEENPNVHVLSIKVLDENAKGNISSVIAGMEYAIEQGVDIINLSLSARSTLENSVLRDYVLKAQEKGITVVGAAGNGGYNVKYFVPGNIEEAIIVGVIDENGSYIANSNFGNSIDYGVVGAINTSEASARYSAIYSKTMKEENVYAYYRIRRPFETFDDKKPLVNTEIFTGQGTNTTATPESMRLLANMHLDMLHAATNQNATITATGSDIVLQDDNATGYGWGSNEGAGSEYGIERRGWAYRIGYGNNSPKKKSDAVFTIYYNKAGSYATRPIDVKITYYDIYNQPGKGVVFFTPHKLFQHGAWFRGSEGFSIKYEFYYNDTKEKINLKKTYLTVGRVDNGEFFTYVDNPNGNVFTSADTKIIKSNRTIDGTNYEGWQGTTMEYSVLENLAVSFPIVNESSEVNFICDLSQDDESYRSILFYIGTYSFGFEVPDISYYDITTSITPSNAGNITPTMNNVEQGSNKTVSWTAKEGYYINKITIDGANQTISNKTSGSKTFNNIQDDHNVKVELLPYRKITTAATNGQITPTITNIENGESKTVTWTPNSGYYISKVTIDGVVQSNPKKAGDSKTFSNIQADHDVKVEALPYRKITTAATNGQITPTITNIENGESKTVTYSPNAGYLLSSVKVDNGSNVAGANPKQYVFNNIQKDYDIKVVYQKQASPVKTVKNSSGTDINEKIVNKGDELVYTISVTNPTELSYEYTIQDVVPANTSYVSSSPNATKSGDNLSWKINVAAGKTGSVSFTVKTTKDGAYSMNEATVTPTTKDGSSFSGMKTNQVKNWTDIEVIKKVSKNNVNIDNVVQAAGTEIDYALTIKNPSNLTKTYTLTDKLPDGLQFVSADLAPTSQNGQTLSWTISLASGASKTVNVKVKILDSAKGKLLKNSATARVDLADESSPEVKTPVMEDPIKKVLQNGANVHNLVVDDESTLTYNISFKNPSDAAKTFTITDEIDPNLTIDESSISDNGKLANGIITWEIKDLAALSEKTLSYNAVIRGKGTKVENIANLTIDGAQFTTNKVITYTNDTYDKKMYIDGVEKDRVIQLAGTEYDYEITIKNPTELNKTAIVTDILDSGLELLGSYVGDAAVAQSGTNTWNIPLAPNETKVLRLHVKIKDVAKGTVIRNTANIKLDKSDEPAPEDDPPMTPVMDDPIKEVFLGEENVDKLFVNDGEELTYNISFSNPSDEDKKVFTVTDKIDEHLKDVKSISHDGKLENGIISWELELEPLEEITLSYNATIFGEAVKAENKANVAVDEIDIDSNVVENWTPKQDEKNVYDTEGNEIDRMYRLAGQELVYTIKVDNISDYTKDFKVEDQLPEGTSFKYADNGGKLNNDENVVEWAFTLAPHQTKTVSVRVIIEEVAKDGVLENSARQYIDKSTIDSEVKENPVLEEPVKKVYNRDGEEIDGLNISNEMEIIYELTVHNASHDNKVFRFEDEYPEFTELIKSNGAEEDKESRMLIWEKELLPDETWTVSYTVKTKAFNVYIPNQAEVFVDKVSLKTNLTENWIPMEPIKTVTNEKGEDAHWDWVVAQDKRHVVYDIFFNNPSDHDAEVIITDKLHEALKLIEVSDNGIWDESTRTITWKLLVPAHTERQSVSVEVEFIPQYAQTKVENNANVICEEFDHDSNTVINYLVDDPTTIDLEGIKTWDDEDNKEGRRPQFIVVELLANGEPYRSAKVQPNKDGEWKYSFSYLPKYMKGEEVKYTVDEYDINGYYPSYDGMNIVNKLIPSPIKKAIKDGKEINEELISIGDEFIYTIEVKNPFDENKEIVIVDAIPEGLQVLEASDNGKIAVDNTLTWKVEVEANASYTVSVKVKVTKKADHILKNKASMIIDGHEVPSNEVILIVDNEEIPAPIKTVTNDKGEDINGQKVEVGQKLTYKIKVENPREKSIEVIIKDKLPNSVKVVTINDGGEIGADNVITWKKEIVSKDSIEVSFEVEVIDTGKYGVIENKAEIEVVGEDNKIGSNSVLNTMCCKIEKAPEDTGKGAADGDNTPVKVVNTGERGVNVILYASLLIFGILALGLFLRKRDN